MASVTETVRYIYDANTKQMVIEVNRASNANDNLTSSTGRTSASIIGFTSVATIGAAALVSLGNAADTAVGNMARVEAVFADSAAGMDGVTTAAENLGNQLGVATNEILLTGASMAVTAENMGFAEDQAEKYGAAVAKLSAVSASYLNIPMADAAERVTAAMRGEAEAAEALGLSLGQTAMTEFVNQQIAAGAAINKTYTEMSSQEQMVVRLIAAIDQMAATMGVATPEVYTLASAEAVLAEITKVASGEVTNQQKVTAALKNTWNEFLVAIQPVTNAIAGLAGFLATLILVILEAIVTNEHFATALKVVTVAVTANIAAVAMLVGLVLKTIDAFLDWIATNENVQKALAMITSALVSLISAILFTIETIAEIIKNTIAWIKSNEKLAEILSFIIETLIFAAGTIAFVIETIAEVIKNTVEWIKTNENAQKAIELVVTAVAIAIAAIVGLVSIIVNVIQETLSWVVQNEAVVEALKSLFDATMVVVSVIAGLVIVVIDIIKKTIDWIRESENIQELLINIGEVVTNVAEFITNLIDTIANVINKFKDWASESELLQRILEGIQKAVEGISGAIETMIGRINSAIDAFQDFRAQDFGSDLVNVGSSSATGTQSITNSTTNNFNITTQKFTSFRDTYRQAQLSTGRGSL